jgi:integrase
VRLETRSGLTVDEAFSLYRDSYGPVAAVSPAQQERCRRVHQSVLKLFGSARLARDLTVADLESYARWRQETIGLAAGGTRATGGARQAEIEVSCIASVLRWIANKYGATDVRPISAEAIKKALRSEQEPARPRFTDEEVSRIEQALDDADPRLVLLITVQGAQRAGQVLRVWRLRVAVERDAIGNVTAVSLDVPGKHNKKAGVYYLTPDATLAMSTALESGYLRDLEAQYQAHGADFPIFPGGIGGLQAGQVAPVGVEASLNRRTALAWFTNLEAKAGVKHGAKRAFHGFPRRAVDVLVKLGATPAQIQAAGGWSSIQIPMEIYRAGISDQDRRQAAALLAKRPAKRPEASAAEDRLVTPTVEVSYPETGPDLAQKARNLTDAEVEEVLELTEWAWEELNFRPHAYQALPQSTGI